MDLKESGISPAYSVALPLCQTAVTIPPSRPTFVDLHVSQFGWSAVSPSRPAISRSVGRGGGQGKRAAASLRRAWGARRALDLDGRCDRRNADQAGCVRTSASASHNPYSASGGGSGKHIKKR